MIIHNDKFMLKFLDKKTKRRVKKENRKKERNRKVIHYLNIKCWKYFAITY